MSGEQRTCAKCGAPMQGSQDWCLQCGAGRPRGGPGWRSAALAIAATGVLALGAAAAAYAALQQKSPGKAVAQTQTTTTSTTTALSTTAPPSGTPTQTPSPSSVTTTTTSTPAAQLKTPSKPPKVPGVTSTPTKKTTSTTSTSTSTTGKEPTSGSEGKGGQPVAVLLDADAAQLYNPRNLASARFGDPSLAIDGDASTAWTMQLEASEAPQVGAGLTLDLNAQLKVAQLTLVTETLGITVQIYGTKSAKTPQSLESEEWVRLSRPHLVKKRKATIDLSQDSKPFRQLLVWIISAPTSSSGQFTASSAAINEIQLYEPK